jgi:hypothetical protein
LIFASHQRHLTKREPDKNYWSVKLSGSAFPVFAGYANRWAALAQQHKEQTMSETIRPLTPQETCAMYHYHNEYASLGIGAIAYYKGLSPRDKRFIDDMTAAIIKAAQPARAVDASPRAPRKNKSSKASRN